MPKSLARFVAHCGLLGVLGAVLCASGFAGEPPKPLRASTLIALVAGAALPENVVYEIKTDGLAFRPDDSYRALLKTAGPTRPSWRRSIPRK